RRRFNATLLVNGFLASRENPDEPPYASPYKGGGWGRGAGTVARVPAGAAVMDLELSDDQVALREGIAAMLAARVPIERVRAGFARAMFDDLAAAGVFSLRNDGFSWSDCVVVFEQLGRACVPGPLASSLLHGRGERAGVLLDGWVEHLGELDVVVVPDEG